MKRPSLLVIVAGVCLLLAPLAGAQQVEPLNAVASSDEMQPVGNETPDLWFVELTSPPAVEGTGLTTLKNEKAAFRASAKKAGVSYVERFTFDTLWNGLSVRVTRADLGKLTRIEGVKAIWPVVEVKADADLPEDAPDLFTALAMTGADIAQSELGYTGAGIRVAIMDTGIDYDHPDLGSCFGPGCRVTTGWDFVGDAFNADSTSPSYNPIPVPDPDPDDCGGHGTHVAGIVGANGAIKGVAPGVTFGAYRVFGCQGSTFSDIMIAAMERALADDMQILNMSIGSSFQWPQYPTAAAADRLVNKGMVVVASIGNAGANGLYAASAPGVGKKVIGVASYDNTHVRLPYFTVNSAKVGYQTMTFSPLPPLSGSAEIVYVGRGCNADPYLADPAGKTALAVRGTCSFAEKAVKAIAAGATAVVIYNNAPGVVNGTLGAPLGSPVPVVGISQADGLFIRAQPAPVTMTWTDQVDSFPAPTGGLISSFSSYGLSPDLSLKPDIGAPGGSIYSTYPLELGGYAVLSGTSMASPHTAGAAALMLEAHPHTPSSAVRTILQNSADPKFWWGNPGLGFLDNVHRQGAGMLDIDDAILATTRIEPGKLALGESQLGPVTRTLTIENSGPDPVTYDLSHAPALATGPNTFTPAFFHAPATVTFSASSVQVFPGGSATFDVTISPHAGLSEKSLYGGYLVLTPQGGGRVYRVPYAGFKGDYQSIPAITPTPNGFPWLAKVVGTSYVNQPSGATFTLQGGDIPYFLVHFDHQVARLEMRIVDAATGLPVHPVFSNVFVEPYLPRNSTSTSFFAFSWDGTRSHDNGKGTLDHRKVVANGTYKVILRALKALGDEGNPAHWETWTSPVITLARP